MPSILYPSAVDTALKAKPSIPRLKSWHETPVFVGSALLPLVPLAAAALSFLSKGVLGFVSLMLPTVAMVFVLKAALAHGGLDLLKLARKGQLAKAKSALTWLDGGWYRLPICLALLTFPAAAYCWMANEAWKIFSPLLKLSRSAIESDLVWNWQVPLAGYLLALMGAMLWGLMRQEHYNSDFRQQFQEYQRQNTSLDLFRRKQVWESVRRLPKVDFDGRESQRGKSTQATLLLLRALQTQGYRLADRPGRESDGARLIPEYELVGLRRGYLNYRADLAITCPARNVKVDIELDGGYHYTPIQRIKDQVRNQEFLGRGWVVIRFDNEEVERDPSGCAARVHQVVTTVQAVPFDVSSGGGELVS